PPVPYTTLCRPIPRTTPLIAAVVTAKAGQSPITRKKGGVSRKRPSEMSRHFSRQKEYCATPATPLASLADDGLHVLDGLRHGLGHSLGGDGGPGDRVDVDAHLEGGIQRHADELVGELRQGH